VRIAGDHYDCSVRDREIEDQVVFVIAGHVDGDTRRIEPATATALRDVDDGVDVLLGGVWIPQERGLVDENAAHVVEDVGADTECPIKRVVDDTHAVSVRIVVMPRRNPRPTPKLGERSRCVQQEIDVEYNALQLHPRSRLSRVGSYAPAAMDDGVGIIRLDAGDRCPLCSVTHEALKTLGTSLNSLGVALLEGRSGSGHDRHRWLFSISVAERVAVAIPSTLARRAPLSMEPSFRARVRVCDVARP